METVPRLRLTHARTCKLVVVFRSTTSGTVQYSYMEQTLTNTLAPCLAATGACGRSDAGGVWEPRRSLARLALTPALRHEWRWCPYCLGAPISVEIIWVPICSSLIVYKLEAIGAKIGLVMWTLKWMKMLHWFVEFWFKVYRCPNEMLKLDGRSVPRNIRIWSKHSSM